MTDDLLAPLSAAMCALAPIPQEELRFVATVAKTISVEEGEYFLRADDVPAYIGFVARGLLRIFHVGSNGVEFTTQFFVAHSVAASYADFLERRPTRYFVQALEDSVLLALDLPTYTELLSRHVCWQILARKVVEDMFSRKLDREIDLLSRDAEERYTRFLTEYPGLEPRLKQYHVASYLGISPVSLSRIRRRLL